jgi:hypothetical protein
MALTGSDDDEKEYELIDGQQLISGGTTAKGLEKEEEEMITTPYHNLDAATLAEHNKNTTTPSVNDDYVSGEDNKEQHNGINNDVDSETKTQVGAGLLFGIPGLIVGGPILGLLLGVGAAVVAKQDDGPAGEGARKAGAFAIETSSVVGEKAREVNERHGIMEKIKIGWENIWKRVVQFDEDHKIGESTKAVVEDVKQKTVEFENEHHWGQQILDGVQNGVMFLRVKLNDVTNNKSNGDNDTDAGAPPLSAFGQNKDSPNALPPALDHHLGSSYARA